MNMKYLVLVSTLMIVFFSSCKEAVEYKDVILFTGTEKSPIIKFTVEGPSVMALTVTATDKVTTDTEVGLAVANDLLQRYNEENKRSYATLPAVNYELENTKAVIKAGSSISQSVRLNIKSLNGLEESKIYCIPITITSVSTGMTVLEPSRTVYILLNRPIVSRAINLGGSCAFNVPKFVTDKRVSSMMAITMEARVRANAWVTSNPYISTVMGVEENYLLRFGDISLNRGDRLQMGPAKIGNKKYFVTGTETYNTDKWYHVASVYDGSSVAIYVNGKLDVQFSVNPGAVNLNDPYFDGFWIGKSERGRLLNGAISEVRIWNRALTSTEIQDNACVVDPKSNGLLAYWHFNTVQEDGVTVRDETGNGFDAVANNKNYTWVENVKCPE